MWPVTHSELILFDFSFVASTPAIWAPFCSAEAPPGCSWPTACPGCLFWNTLPQTSVWLTFQVFSARPFPATRPPNPRPSPHIYNSSSLLCFSFLSVLSILYICAHYPGYCLSSLLECELREARYFCFYVCCSIPMC